MPLRSPHLNLPNCPMSIDAVSLAYKICTLVTRAYHLGCHRRKVINRALTVQNKKDPSIFLKIQSKHRQVIPCKFPKSFRGAANLVVFYDFFCDFFGFSDFPKFTKHHQVTSTPETLGKPAWNHLTVFWFNFERNRRFFFFYGPSPSYKSHRSYKLYLS